MVTLHSEIDRDSTFCTVVCNINKQLGPRHLEPVVRRLVGQLDLDRYFQHLAIRCRLLVLHMGLLLSLVNLCTEALLFAFPF